MPPKPATYCHRCDGICTGQCKAAAKREIDQQRAGDPVRRLKNTARWRNGTRPIVLRRCNYLCVECGKASATVADHYPMSAREIVAKYGVNQFFNPDRCRGLCKRCHDSSTAVREGFASKKD